MFFEATPQPSEHLLPGMYALHEEVACRRRANHQAWGWAFLVGGSKLPDPSAQCARPPG
jgi:para-nitrobenzyl esterase